MTKEIAQVIIQFMNRVQLQGTEVQAWLTVMKALDEVVNPPTKASTETND